LDYTFVLPRGALIKAHCLCPVRLSPT